MGQDGPNDSESGPAVDIVEGSPVTPDGITLGQLGVLQILCAVPPGRFDWAVKRIDELKEVKSCYGWGAFLDLLAKYYITAEKAMRLQLFHRKGSFADVKAKFDVLIEKLQYSSSVRESRRYVPDEADREIHTLNEQLVIVARTRRDLLELLSHVSGGSTVEERAAEEDKVDKALCQFHSSIKESSVGKVKQFCATELGAAHALLRADGCCTRHDFTTTVLWLSRAKVLLNEFRDTCAGTIPPPPPMISDSTELRGVLQIPNDEVAPPRTLEYLSEVFRRLTQKATVLFHHLLLRPKAAIGPPQTGKPSQKVAPKQVGNGHTENNAINYEIVHMLEAFQHTTSAGLVALFYSMGDTAEGAEGYHHPALEQDTIAGLRSFPAVFACPPLPPPLHASIYMLVSENEDLLRADGVVVFDESARASRSERDRGSTYYLATVDPSITLALVFPNKGRWRTTSKSKATDFVTALRRVLRRAWQAPHS